MNVMFTTPARRRGAAEGKREMCSVKWKPFRKLVQRFIAFSDLARKDEALKISPEGNSEICFPETINVSGGATH